MTGVRNDGKRVPDPESDSSHLNGASDELVDDVDFEPEDDLGDVASARAKLKKLRDELVIVKKERQDYLNGWQRCKADAINQKKDAERAIDRIGSAKIERLVEAMIPALDSFDMAMATDSWKNVDTAWRMGVENIKNQLDSALATVGISPFGAPGDVYDPAQHEIVSESEEGGESGTIAQVLRRGWRENNRIIRAAHVVVSTSSGGKA